ASILALASSISPPAISGLATSGSKRPNWRSKALATSSNGWSHSRRTWSTTKRESFTGLPPGRWTPNRPYTRTPPRTNPDRMAVQTNRFQRPRFAIVLSLTSAGEAGGTLPRSRWSLPQLHAGACGPCHQPAALVLDIALDVAHGASCPDDPGLGGQGGLPNCPEEVDLQIDGRERLSLPQRGGVGVPHRCVGQVAEGAAVQGAHRVVMALVGLHLEDGPAWFDGLQHEPQQPGNRGQGCLPLHHLLSEFEHRRHVRFLPGLTGPG